MQCTGCALCIELIGMFECCMISSPATLGMKLYACSNQ